MKYAFIEAHRVQFCVRSMRRVLMVHFSGFYAWLKEPLSHRAQDDARQTNLIRRAWEDSGKVYGYRKLHDELRDQGEVCSQNRVARLAGLAGIAAQIALGVTVASLPSWPRTNWPGSSKLMRRTRFGWSQSFMLCLSLFDFVISRFNNLSAESIRYDALISKGAIQT